MRDVDRSARDLERRIDKAEYWRAQRTTSSGTALRNDAQMARDVLAELGIDQATDTKGSTS